MINQRDQVAHGASESIESPDKQDIAAMKLVEAGVKSRAISRCARRLIGEDQFFRNAILLQSIELQIKILAARADTGIPDQTRIVGRSKLWEHRLLKINVASLIVGRSKPTESSHPS